MTSVILSKVLLLTRTSASPRADDPGADTRRGKLPDGVSPAPGAYPSVTVPFSAAIAGEIHSYRLVPEAHSVMPGWLWLNRTAIRFFGLDKPA